MKHAVPARIVCATSGVDPTVNFHDEADRMREEVNEVPINGHLTLERDAKLLAGKLTPQKLLGPSTIATKGLGTLRDEPFATTGSERMKR